MINRVVPVGSIKVANRIRKEFGDISSLANDIKENGLLNPVTLTPDGKLLAGERRLRAVQELGWQTVDARVVENPDDLQALKIEITENENRKEFTFSEKMAYAKLLHDMYDARARANSAANLKNSGNSSSGNDFPVGRVRDRIADEVDLGSGRNLQKAEYVADHATPEMIAALDAEQLSINAAYKQLKEQAKKAEEENRSLAKELADAQEDVRREKAAKNQLEREEDEASTRMEQMNLQIFDLQDKIAALNSSDFVREHQELQRKCEDLQQQLDRKSALLKQNTEMMLETERTLEALRNSSGIKRAGMVVDICDKIAALAFELEEFENDDFVSMEPMTRSEISMTMTNTIHSLENLRSAVQSAERKSA